AYGPQNDVTLKMPAFEWVHVQLHQQKGMISLSPPTICNSAGLLGTDTGMSPTEYIMQALAGCYTATLTMMAAEKGIDLDGIELDLNFDINLNGFLGLDSNVRKGAKSIRVDVHLTSKTASREELEALVSEMQKNSPIHDTLANPVEMITRLA
ncbi:OsmC family protein, partial [Klebsiella quasipneumoniae]|uniref:OsmC family protein n=1 Tax=Klebsiella quasipneumoniae TaxID=1463165 RepID=UPI0021148144